MPILPKMSVRCGGVRGWVFGGEGRDDGLVVRQVVRDIICVNKARLSDVFKLLVDLNQVYCGTSGG